LSTCKYKLGGQLNRKGPRLRNGKEKLVSSGIEEQLEGALAATAREERDHIRE